MVIYYRRDENDIKYLDLDATMDELMSDFNLICDKGSVVMLRTKLSVRVHTVIGKFHQDGSTVLLSIFSLPLVTIVLFL